MASRSKRRCGKAVVTLAMACSTCTGQVTAQRSQAVEANRLFQEGSAAFQAGDLRKADAAFARLVKLVPGVAAAHSALGATLLGEGRREAAVAELQTALRLDSADIRAEINLAMAYRALDQDAKAVELFRRATMKPGISLDGNESAAYGSALAIVGDLAGAEKVLDGAVAMHPGDAVLLDSLGAVLAQRSRMAEARERFEQALAVDGDNGSAHAHLGSALLAMSDPEGAVEQIQIAVRLGNRSPTTLVELSRALLAIGRSAEAEGAAREALKAVPGSFEARYALALAEQAGEEPAKSLPLFAALVTEKPNSREVLINYGLCLLQTGDARQAIAIYERALAAGGGSATLREDLGSAYLQLNQVDEAIEQFNTGLKGEEANPRLHYDLGLAYKLKDDTDESVRELRRAEQLDPQLPDAAYTLGVLEMQQGHFTEAATELQRAVTLQPKNGEAWSLLGSVYQQSGDPDKAADALRHAIELLPTQPSPHVTLAAVLAARGDRQGAASERKTAADLSRAAVNHQRAQFALNSGKALLQQGKVQDALLQLRVAVEAEPGLIAAHSVLAEALRRSGEDAEAASERAKADALLAKAGPGSDSATPR